MAKKETSSRISSIAARGAKHPGSLTLKEIKAVCASALSQDETKGQGITKRALKRLGLA